MSIKHLKESMNGSNQTSKTTIVPVKHPKIHIWFQSSTQKNKWFSTSPCSPDASIAVMAQQGSGKGTVYHFDIVSGPYSPVDFVSSHYNRGDCSSKTRAKCKKNTISSRFSTNLKITQAEILKKEKNVLLKHSKR